MCVYAYLFIHIYTPVLRCLKKSPTEVFLSTQNITIQVSLFSLFFFPPWSPLLFPPLVYVHYCIMLKLWITIEMSEKDRGHVSEAFFFLCLGILFLIEDVVLLGFCFSLLLLDFFLYYLQPTTCKQASSNWCLTQDICFVRKLAHLAWIFFFLRIIWGN